MPNTRWFLLAASFSPEPRWRVAPKAMRSLPRVSCRIPSGFCQPQAPLQNTARDIAPKAMQSLPHISCRIPGGFCQPQASLQNTAGDIAPKSMRSLPHVQAANQRHAYAHILVTSSCQRGPTALLDTLSQQCILGQSP
jgi:hypothetical protein